MQPLQICVILNILDKARLTGSQFIKAQATRFLLKINLQIFIQHNVIRVRKLSAKARFTNLNTIVSDVA